MPRLCLLILSLAALVVSGCAKDRDENNELWRQGYGYNNPNADRIKQGKEAVDF